MGEISIITGLTSSSSPCKTFLTETHGVFHGHPWLFFLLQSAVTRVIALLASLIEALIVAVGDWSLCSEIVSVVRDSHLGSWREVSPQSVRYEFLLLLF